MGTALLRGTWLSTGTILPLPFTSFLLVFLFSEFFWVVYSVLSFILFNFCGALEWKYGRMVAVFFVSQGSIIKEKGYEL